MAILGVQLILTVAVASVMQRLTKHVSFGQWFLCSNLFRYLCPTDDELRQAAGISHNQKQQKVRRRRDDHHEQNSPFTIPKATAITLDSAQLSPIDCLPLKYYPEYQWLLDVSLSALFVYVFTENYVAWFAGGTKELNLSLIWCLFVLASSLKLLLTLTSQYFRSQDFAEGILCCIFGFFFLIVSMGVLVLPEHVLDLGLDRAYEDFSTNADKFLKTQGINSSGHLSMNTFKIVIALLSALIGLLMTFPGIRFARMHTDAVRHSAGKPLRIMCLYMNFLFPLVLILLWVKPAVYDHVTRPTGYRPALMSDETFHSFRLWSVGAFCLFRFLMTKPHLQAHLNMAQDRVQELKREAGRITNTDFQKLILHVHYYLCVVALQYLLPVLILLFTCLCMKTMGGLSWTGSTLLTDKVQNNSTTVNQGPVDNSTVAQVTMSLAGLQGVFTNIWYHGLFSYFTFWILGTWSVTSFFGILYHVQFTS